MKTNNLLKLGIIFLFGILFFGIVSAQSSTFSQSTPQTSAFAGGSASYLANQGIELFPSTSGVTAGCGAGQDFVLQISPMGCSPSVITSDLLEEQNVPVFCPIVATQVNPLITINSIDSMSFPGTYPKEVSGVGFHPAQAAIKGTNNNLLNYPILDNVGYAVIVLKRNENESSMPDFVDGTLTAQIRYDINNAFGIGDSQFRIPELTDEEWEARYKEYSFWQGKGFLRLESIGDNEAEIGVYEDKDDLITSVSLNPGEISGKTYLRKSYCLAGLQVKLDGLENPDTRVRLQVDSDYTELKLGDKFLENRCVVKDLGKRGLVKKAEISCTDDLKKTRTMKFDISPRLKFSVDSSEKILVLGDKLEGVELPATSEEKAKTATLIESKKAVLEELPKTKFTPQTAWDYFERNSALTGDANDEINKPFIRKLLEDGIINNDDVYAEGVYNSMEYIKKILVSKSYGPPAPAGELTPEQKDEFVTLAEKSANLAEVQRFLAQNPAYLNAQDQYGNTALIQAANRGNLEIVQFLLTQREIKVNAQNNAKNTALIWAAYYCNLGIVQALLGFEGINVNIQDEDGKTALDYALGLADEKKDKKEIIGALERAGGKRGVDLPLQSPPLFSETSSTNRGVYLAYIDVKTGGDSSKDADLVAYFVLPTSDEEKKYVSNGKLNDRGKEYFSEIIKGIIPGDEIDDKTGKYTGKIKEDIWRVFVSSTATKISDKDIKLNGYAPISAGIVASSGAGAEGDSTPCISETNCNNAIGTYRNLKDKYKTIGWMDEYGSSISGADTYAVRGLKNAIELAILFKDYKTRDELVRELLELDSSEGSRAFVESKISGYLSSNSEGSIITQTIYINGKYRTISFVDVYEPKFEDYGVKIKVRDDTGKILSDMYKQNNQKLKIETEAELKVLRDNLAKINSELERINSEIKRLVEEINKRIRQDIDKTPSTAKEGDLISEASLWTSEYKVSPKATEIKSRLDKVKSQISQYGQQISDKEALLQKLNIVESNVYQIETKEYDLTKNQRQSLQAGFITLKNLEKDYAVFDINLEDPTKSQTNIKIPLNEVYDGYKYQITVEEIYLNKVAKVSVISNIDRAGTTANVSFSIGIEKRNIELSPDKIDNMIDNLNDSIEDWTDKSEKLGNVVDGMQKACIATAGALVVKNLFLGGGGSVEARKKTMESARDICQKKIALGKYKTERDCINKEGDLITSLQKKNEAIIEQQNTEAEGFREKLEETNGEAEYRKALAGNIAKDESANADTLTSASQNGDVSVEQLKDYRYCQLFIKQVGSDTQFEQQVKECRDKNSQLITQLSQDKSDRDAMRDYGSEYLVEPETKKEHIVPSAQKEWREIKSKYNLPTGQTLTDTDRVSTFAVRQGGQTKHYLAVLSTPSGGKASATKVYQIGDDKRSLTETKGFSNYVFTKAGDFNRAIDNPQVRYFGSSPDKDYPSIVPFPFPGSQKNGYYVGVRHYGIESGYKSSFQASGANKEFYVCNAVDGKVDFDSSAGGFSGGDSCTQVSIRGGVFVGADNVFSLGTSKTKELYSTAYKALDEAKRKKSSGGKVSDIMNMAVSVGDFAFDTPVLQCQDFFSPTDCAWLFNLCDPVICPSSRCDLGGVAPRANVIQSGIIGGVLLCLPNFNVNPTKGVIIPLCLSGIKAGIDGYISLLNSYRDCLVEKQQKGKNVGICDEVYSVHLCNLFWEEAASLKDVIIPKILDFFTTGELFSQRGGGEYLGGEAAWRNARESVSFFTQSYATNAYESFKVQAIDEVKNSVCKNSISGVFPEVGVLESMTEVSSPPQFNVLFEEIPFTDATIPPTSQYRVFYHIFAGNNDGVYYQVYLSAPQGQSVYSLSPTYSVASGYIAVGQTASEKRDFTAPSGYTKVCTRINNQEECGFKEVSSSFAVDFVTDKISQSDALDKNIKTESECNNGGFNAGNLVNPNLQAGISNTATPNLYSKGITRICSNFTPDGKDAASSSWTEVGYCDDKTIRCWLDKNSVKDALEIKGVEGETLDELGQAALDKLDKIYMSIGEYNNFVAELNKLLEGDAGQVVNTLANGEEDKINTKPEINNKQIFFDWQKAKLLYILGQAHEKLARVELDKKNQAPVATTPETAMGETLNIPLSFANANDALNFYNKNRAQLVGKVNNDNPNNLAFVEALRKSVINGVPIITQEQYDDIIGVGWLNSVKDMDYVVNKYLGVDIRAAEGIGEGGGETNKEGITGINILSGTKSIKSWVAGDISSGNTLNFKFSSDNLLQSLVLEVTGDFYGDVRASKNNWWLIPDSDLGVASSPPIFSPPASKENIKKSFRFNLEDMKQDDKFLYHIYYNKKNGETEHIKFEIQRVAKTSGIISINSETATESEEVDPAKSEELYQFILIGKLNEVQTFLTNNPSYLNVPLSENNLPPLLFAIFIYNRIGGKTLLDIVEYLINLGANVNSRNSEGSTELFYLCGNNYWEDQGLSARELQIAQLLITHEADVNLPGYAGNTPLMIAATNLNFPFVEFLITNGANVNAVNNAGKTALDFANNPENRDESLRTKYKQKIIAVLTNREAVTGNDLAEGGSYSIPPAPETPTTNAGESESTPEGITSLQALLFDSRGDSKDASESLIPNTNYLTYTTNFDFENSDKLGLEITGRCDSVYVSKKTNWFASFFSSVKQKSKVINNDAGYWQYYLEDMDVGDKIVYTIKCETKTKTQEIEFSLVRGEAASSAEGTKTESSAPVLGNDVLGKDLMIWVSDNKEWDILDGKGEKFLGANWKKEYGTLRIFKGAGDYVGQSMTGGEIIIEKDAGDYLGHKMRGGEIIANGKVGDSVGSFMRGGVITINGEKVGDRLGEFMDRDLVGSTTSKGYGEIFINVKNPDNIGNEIGYLAEHGIIRFSNIENKNLIIKKIATGTYKPSSNGVSIYLGETFLDNSEY